MRKTLIFYLTKYTELLDITFFDCFLFTIFFFLALISFRVSQIDFLSLLKHNENLCFSFVILTLIVFTVLYFENFSIIIRVMAVFPFIFVLPLSLNSKLFLMFTNLVCWLLVIFLLPYVVIQKNEVILYIFLVCSNVFLYKYLNNIKHYFFNLLFLVFYNLLFLSIYSIAACSLHIFDFSEMSFDFLVACFFTFGIIYFWIFGIYYYTITKCYKNIVVKTCNVFNNKSKIGVFVFCVCMCLCSLSIKCIYVFNVFLYGVLDVLGVLELKVGTKNPHHTFMCKKWTRNFSGVASCTEFCSSAKFYKQTLASERVDNVYSYKNKVINCFNRTPSTNMTAADLVLKTKILNLYRDLQKSPIAHPHVFITLSDIVQVHALTHSKLVDNLVTSQLPNIEPIVQTDKKITSPFFKQSYVAKKGFYAAKSESGIDAFCKEHRLRLPIDITNPSEYQLILLSMFMRDNPKNNQEFINTLISVEMQNKEEYIIEKEKFLKALSSLEKALNDLTLK